MKIAVIFLYFLSSLAIASNDQILAEKNTKFSIVKENELYLWNFSRNEFHIEFFSFKLNDNKYWTKHILILEEYDAKTHISIPMLKSKLKLTAWELTEKDIKEKLWVIEAEADKWESKGSEIVLTKFGCCDNPDKTYRYSTVTGEMKK